MQRNYGFQIHVSVRHHVDTEQQHQGSPGGNACSLPMPRGKPCKPCAGIVARQGWLATHGWRCSGTRVLPACKSRRRRRLCRAGRRLCWRQPRSQAKRQECLLDLLAKAASLEPRGGSGEHSRSQCSLADCALSNNLYLESGPGTILSLATCCGSGRWLLRQHKTRWVCRVGHFMVWVSLLCPSTGAQLPAPE